MKAKILNISVIRLIVLLLFAGRLFAQIGAVVLSIPSPGGETTGLTWDGNHLWNADTGTNLIYQIDPINGTVVYSIPAPSGSIINGLTWDGNYLWCSDRQNNLLFKIDISDSSIVHVIPLTTTSPRGLAYDGEYLWYQDSAQRKIYRLNLQTGAYLDSIPSPGGYNRGLCWDGKYLWSSDNNKGEIYLLDSTKGQVITILSAPGSYSYGLAFDGEYIWNADFETDRIYKIAVTGSEKYQISDPIQVRIRYSVRIKNVGTGNLNLKTFMACPYEAVYQHLLDSLIFDPVPVGFFLDKYVQKIAYHQENIPVGEQKIYQWSQAATLYNIRYFLHPDSVGSIEQIPPAVLNLYTSDGENYKLTDSIIVAAAREAIGDETNLYWQVRQLHDYVLSHIEYVDDDRWDDAATVLRQGHGSCSEYSFLFIALCRAAGIPARYEAGGHLRVSIPYEDRVFHRWQQVYFPNYGWIPIDCTWDDKQYPCNQARYFGAASNQAFSTTIGGGGEYGLWWSYNSANQKIGSGSYNREKVMEWLPYVTSVETVVEQLPENYKTCFNYPNPFNSETVIQFHLSVPSSIAINIFNPMGQLIKSWDATLFYCGWQRLYWNATDNSGIPVSSGIYIYQIIGNGSREVGRMTLIK